MSSVGRELGTLAYIPSRSLYSDNAKNPTGC